MEKEICASAIKSHIIAASNDSRLLATGSSTETTCPVFADSMGKADYKIQNSIVKSALCKDILWIELDAVLLQQCKKLFLEANSGVMLLLIANIIRHRRCV